MKILFQPESRNTVAVSLRTDPVRLDLASPVRRRGRKVTGALILSLVIHGAALAAVVMNPARFFSFTGEAGGAPGTEALNIAFAAEPVTEEIIEEETEERSADSRSQKRAARLAPVIAVPMSVPEYPVQSLTEPPEPMPLVFVTHEALADLPPGYEPPARPKPTVQAPKQAPSKAAASNTNTAKIPKPGSAGPVTEAKIKRQMGVHYPEEARREGVEGLCIVEIVINSVGKVNSARISKSSGDARLDREALRAAKSSLFHAAMKGDTAVASKARMPFQFVIR